MREWAVDLGNSRLTPFLRSVEGKMRSVGDERQASVSGDEEIREQALREGVVQPTFETEVLDDQDQVVAEVEKLLHVRWKGATK